MPIILAPRCSVNGHKKHKKAQKTGMISPGYSVLFIVSSRAFRGKLPLTTDTQPATSKVSQPKQKQKRAANMTKLTNMTNLNHSRGCCAVAGGRLVISDWTRIIGNCTLATWVFVAGSRGFVLQNTQKPKELDDT
ncbi:hypothetical protein Pla144_03620 [Bythopirellula polymerisocia]|uniref:Uncharacterized protein n=1 Tax=Bythopirellula polymerisocia TaxID=2528003 RepID=A0A5C6D182_9BACT|nr:hypothetical protein Pla144_03620 [Bythopirellula polymerisocia]